MMKILKHAFIEEKVRNVHFKLQSSSLYGNWRIHVKKKVCLKIITFAIFSKRYCHVYHHIEQSI